MREMFDNLHYCKYRDCMHVREDGCYVKELVDSGKIMKTRYDNYKYFIEKKKWDLGISHFFLVNLGGLWYS